MKISKMTKSDLEMIGYGLVTGIIIVVSLYSITGCYSHEYVNKIKDENEYLRTFNTELNQNYTECKHTTEEIERIFKFALTNCTVECDYG